MWKVEVESYDPKKDPYLDNRLRSEKPITFLGFIDELNRLWKLAGKKGEIIREAPFDENAKFPVITYQTIRRLVSQDFKEIKPRLRATIRHPYIPNEYVELYGQLFDVWVQFNIYSLSADEADELVMEFDDFIHTYKGFFKKNGVHEILFYAQESDKVVKDYRFPLACRPLQYTLRFEKITPVFLNQLQHIYVQAEIQSQQQSQQKQNEEDE